MRCLTYIGSTHLRWRGVPCSACGTRKLLFFNCRALDSSDTVHLAVNLHHHRDDGDGASDAIDANGSNRRSN